jgi:eukaryotic-like serine/threonine-protein kinase
VPRVVRGRSGQRLKLGSELGRGGFGVVYLAAGENGASYAVKLIGPVHGPEAEESFEREVQSTQDVENDHVLRVEDFGSAQELSGDRYIFTVSEFCSEGDYRQRLKGYHGNPADLAQIVGDFRQILDGLEALHTRIVHRDVKPENVLVSKGVLKIGDFGLSKFVDEATKTLTFKGSGSPRYMAPEVWMLQHATPAADLYAVGIMLFEACTGRAPFQAADLLALREMHCFRSAPRAKSINPTIPDRLDGIIKKLLEKEPALRYRTAGEVFDALARASVDADMGGDIAEIAAKLRRHHDAREESALKAQVRRESENFELQLNRYMAQQLLEMFGDVVSDLNSHLEEVKITETSVAGERTYKIGDRSLIFHFFRAGEIYSDPEVPGRMETLRKRHVVHGGYIEIRDKGEDHEGWNLVLVRPEGSMYGTWILVETEISVLSGRTTKYTPIATEARVFADNLACHWMRAMHIYNLKDKPLKEAMR